MEKFKKGDILRGKKRSFEEAWHPIVFIGGPAEAPLAVVLTHTETKVESCNLKLLGIYDSKDHKPQYFVAHLIQKMSEWGPYQKKGELTKENMELVEKTVSGAGSITWAEYLDYKKDGCPDHKKATAQRPSK